MDRISESMAATVTTFTVTVVMLLLVTKKSKLNVKSAAYANVS